MACPLQPTRAPLTTAERAARDEANRNAPTHLLAASMQVQKDGITELDGSVELTRGANRITAEHLRFDKLGDTAEAHGGVQFRDTGGSTFFTDDLKLQLGTQLGETGASRYTLGQGRGRGDAERIEFLGPDYARLRNARYTACQEGQDDWFLNIGRLDLDMDEEIGTAYNASLDIFGVPVFYFPYMNFPITNRRKSGFLAPVVGHSSKLGYIAAAPYYFNLAPNYDATISPRYMTKRGLQLQNEFRYLTEDATGKINIDVLPNDSVTDKTRALGFLQHQQTFNSLWSSKIDLRGVSDKEYFDDFGDRLSLTSQSSLPELMEAVYRGQTWTFATRFTGNQIIDTTIPKTSYPYIRVPQIQLVNTDVLLPNRWYPQFESEWTRFDHRTLLTGQRFNVNTGVSLPLQNDWGFVAPKIGARYISYRLDRDDDTSPALARGLFSLDSGLIFERDSRWGERDMIQTLEPRLFYLYVPPKNQDALPNFDTGIPDLSFVSLFRENRFVGGDRIGDANQITAAVSTRFLDAADGRERLRLSLGRIYYLDNELEVNLPPGNQQRPSSDLVAEASAWLIGNWHARETIQWNAGEHQTERNSFYLQYQPAHNKIVNIGQASVRDQIGQYDVSTEWPLFGRWSVRARSRWSYREDRNLETYAGVEYNACCWALRVVAARRWQNPEQVNSILFQLELAALSKLGHIPESPLNQGLFGFKDESRDELFTE